MITPINGLEMYKFEHLSCSQSAEVMLLLLRDIPDPRTRRI